MKIKNIFSTVLLVVTTSVISFAQFTNCKVEDINKLKAGTLTVAISDDDVTNKSVNEIMTAYWTVCKFQVIKRSELDAHVKANPQNYILSYINNNESRIFTMSNTQMASTAGAGTRTRTATIGDGLMLTENVKKVKRLKPTDGMMYTFIDVDMAILDERAEFIRQVGQMNEILMFPNLKDNQIGGWKVPTMDHNEIVKKELWVAQEDLNEKGEEAAKMKAAYNPYKYKVVSKAEIAKAIVEKRKDIVYVACAEYQAGAYTFVVHSAVDNRVLFFMGGTKGFDSKSLEKIKNNKTYGQ